jgi:hypothetical protein
MTAFLLVALQRSGQASFEADVAQKGAETLD